MELKTFLKQTENLPDDQVVQIKGKEHQGLVCQVSVASYLLSPRDGSQITLGQVRRLLKKTQSGLSMSLRLDVLDNVVFDTVKGFLINGDKLILSPN